MIGVVRREGASSPFVFAPPKSETHPLPPSPSLLPTRSHHEQVAVTGRSGVGKTALVHHACCSDWVGSFAETLGTCVMQASSVTTAAGDASETTTTTSYNFWEVGGRYAAKFPYAVRAQLHGADVVVHVFSFSDRGSLQSVSTDVANLRKDGNKAPVILLGAKRDCVSTCQLSLEEARHVAAECNLPLVLVDSPPVNPEDAPRGGGNAAAVPLFEALIKAARR